MSVRDTMPPMGETRAVLAGYLPGDRALWVQIRRVTSLDVAEYSAGVLLATPREALVEATRRALGTVTPTSRPPPEAPTRPEEDAPPEAWDAYVVACDEHAEAMRLWKHDAAPEIIDRQIRDAASMGERDRMRIYRTQVGLFCSAVVATAQGPDGEIDWKPSEGDWEPERFAAEETDDRTGVARLPPDVVPRVAERAYDFAVGGEEAKRRIARFRGAGVGGGPRDV